MNPFRDHIENPTKKNAKWNVFIESVWEFNLLRWFNTTTKQEFFVWGPRAGLICLCVGNVKTCYIFYLRTVSILTQELLELPDRLPNYDRGKRDGQKADVQGHSRRLGSHPAVPRQVPPLHRLQRKRQEARCAEVEDFIFKCFTGVQIIA